MSKNQKEQLTTTELTGIMDVVLDAREEQIHFGPTVALVHQSEEFDFE